MSGVILVWCGACAALGGAVREYAGTVVSSGTSGYSRCWSVSMLSGSWSPVAFFLACGFFLVVVLYILHSATAVHVHVHTDIVGIRNPEVCSPRTLTCSRPDPRLCPIIIVIERWVESHSGRWRSIMPNRGFVKSVRVRGSHGNIF